MQSIAIVGGGPAGAVAAARLARAGRQVVLFDERLAWEKPCGGGLTLKALDAWPMLRDLPVERNWVRDCELVSPSGEKVSFHLEHAVAIFSRQVLNGLLLDAAREAGAEIVRDRVVTIEGEAGNWRLTSNLAAWDAGFVVLAAGARDSFRAKFSRPFAPEDLMVTAGYYIPAQSGKMLIQFPRGVHGYIWIFPRLNHVSAGICGKMNHSNTATLRRVLETSLAAMGLDFHDAPFYSHILPSPRASTLRETQICGEGWAMIGDAAGFVDPITGEGLYYAMRSGDLLADALLSGEPGTYEQLVRKDFLPELALASRTTDRFYSGQWMGQSVAERMIQFTRHSSTFRCLLGDLFSGAQGYLDLKQRFYRSLPRMLAESLLSTVGLSGSRSGMHADSRAS